MSLEAGSPDRGTASHTRPRVIRRPGDPGEPPFVRIYPGSSEPPGEHPSRKADTTIVVAFLILSILAGAGFVAVYWNGANTQLLGGCLAIMFLAFGFALVFWAHKLMLHQEATAPREPLPSAVEDRQAVFEEFYPGEPRIQRRGIVTWMGLAIVGALGAAVISSLRSFYGHSPLRVQLTGAIWKRGQQLVTDTGEKVTVNTLQIRSAAIVFPEDRIGDVRAQTVLLRVPENSLHLPWNRSDWAPQGYVAYSRVCTHAGCPVGEFESNIGILLCPCHQSTFDVLTGANPTSGPAARPLPQLPLYIDLQGNVRAAGDFSSPPGPGYWSIPS